MGKQINFKTKDGKEIKFSNSGVKKEKKNKVKELEKKIKMMEKSFNKVLKQQPKEIKKKLEIRGKEAKHKVGIRKADTPEKHEKWVEEGKKIEAEKKELEKPIKKRLTTIKDMRRDLEIRNYLREAGLI